MSDLFESSMMSNLPPFGHETIGPGIQRALQVLQPSVCAHGSVVRDLRLNAGAVTPAHGGSNDQPANNFTLSIKNKVQQGLG